MTYQVLLSSGVKKQLRKLDRVVQVRIGAVIELLTQNPRPPGAKKLQGHQSLWRVRSSDYRVVYEIEDNRLVITFIFQHGFLVDSNEISGCS